MLPLVCLDVDGTMVGSSGEPSAALWTAAERARDRGQHLTLCTARLAAGPTRAWAERLDPDGWHVFHTGGAIWHPSSGEVVTQSIPQEAVDQVSATAAERDWVFEAYSWDDLAVDSDAPLALAHAVLLGLEHRRRPIASLPGPIVRAQLVVPIEDTAAAVRAAPVGCIGSAATSPSMPGVAFVSVTTSEVSKAAGVAMVAGQFGIGMGQVMMVGDGQNDLSAMRAVGWPVAIGDGAPEVIEAARQVVAGVDEDGAAQAIDRSADLSG